MKYKEIFEQIINEINMSPAGLRSLVANINAQAGMEFEMIVPGAAESDEDDDYQEPDMDRDESISSIQDAYDFFYDGDFNGRRDVERLRDQMRDNYNEWLSEQVDDRWETDKEEAIYDWLRYNVAPSEVLGDILGQKEDENGNYPDPTKEDYRNAAAKVAENPSSSWYGDAQEDFNDNFYGNADMEEEWLESVNINSMWDVQDNYNITWPHYYNPNTGGGDVSIEDAADSFARAIGREVKASDNYHSRAITRPDANNLHYVVEPDGSLEADDDQDGGLEFVSPALPINELLDDLKKVKAWADKTGCYTNDSTGLHINVSVPNWKGDMSQLDYVKLAVLMGDEYVLNEFGRAGNTYAKSALKMVKDHIAQRPEDTKALLDKMREHLNTSAAKVIHSGNTSKYTSINTKTGYIEFRSPGGDWLNENFDKIENTLYRFVVALDAAVDETKYKQEYAKKLYKLLTGNDRDNTDTMAYFAKYAAGDLPQSALKSFVRQAQLERKVQKDPTGGQKYWWSVGRPGYGASVNVVATSKEEAIEKGKAEYPDWANATNMTAKPVRPFETESTPRYEIFNLNTNNSVEDAEGITNDRDALIRLNDYLEHGPHRLTARQARDMFGIRRVGGDGEPILAQPIRATVGAPQPAGSVGRDATSPTGQWKIIDGLGREIYRFRPAVNTRAKANELAAVWARELNFDGNYQVEPAVDIAVDRTANATALPSQLMSPFVWRVFGSNDSPYQRQGVEVIAFDEFEAMQRARREWNLNTSGATEADFFRANGWRATPDRPASSGRPGAVRPIPGVTDIEPDISTSSPAPVRGSTQDLQQQRAQGGFTGAWKILDTDTGQELYRFSGIGNSQADANRVAANWLRQNGPEDADMTQIEVVPVMGQG